MLAHSLGHPAGAVLLFHGNCNYVASHKMEIVARTWILPSEGSLYAKSHACW